MDKTLLARVYAFAMSALFATVATVGVAVMMASGSAPSNMGVGAAAAQEAAQPVLPHVSQWQAPAAASKQDL